ncbi:hypothetical protein DCAR_0100407 [Daucus carota subsp. sativus]|uniref:RING-type domain-containing protein n=1 Tax=Daucus carota subsp. sativus TaxID=79200 RepID=A0AAF0W0B8_DAUCS|nr:PREDICTED: E3 ubiquitin-protein ligase RHA1B-like [Daucus carota subsp. sativus]WOG81262.1 hypothetical protein DCAR_0100407 [Daucus carota subsp. sativus]
MEFPVSYKIFSFPKFIHNTLHFLRSIKDFVFTILFFHPCAQDIYLSTRFKTRHEVPTLLDVLTRELLPVVKYSELVDPPQTCAVCLNEFSGCEEIRRLPNCQHVYHRNCVDRWMDHEQKTCPLCRTPFISDDMQAAFNERLWTASGISDFY